MAYLKSIIKHLKINFSIYIEDVLNEDIRIENTQYLIPGTVNSVILQPLTLYIGDYQEFSSLSPDGAFLFLDTPPDVLPAVHAAYIHHSMDIPALLNAVQNLLYQSHLANMRKEEMFQILHAGYGVQSILDTANMILENPLTMCTTSFSVIAVSPKDDTHESFEMYNGKSYLRKQSLEHMTKNRVIERLYQSTSPIITSFDDVIGTNFVFCSIRINRAAVGYLCLRCSVRPYTAEDLTFLTDVAKILSIEMQKDEFYNHQTGITYEYFMRDLIEQNITSTEFALHRMEQFGRLSCPYFWVLVFSFPDDSINKLNAQYYIDQLIGILRSSICFAYKGKLVLLLTSLYPDPFYKTDRTKFENFLRLNQLNVAVSYRYEEILNTYLYYRQALFLLKKAVPTEKDNIIFYKDIYPCHLFSLVSNQFQLKAMLHPDIIALLHYDADHGTDYIATLKSYFANHRNALKTATALHIHKSTFFYRIGKIQSLTGLDLEDESLLFAYEFSFHLLAFLKTSK
ncbi:MAG: PucR family transcriptional regulator [Lachnospiraceae bacterium]